VVWHSSGFPRPLRRVHIFPVGFISQSPESSIIDLNERPDSTSDARSPWVDMGSESSFNGTVACRDLARGTLQHGVMSDLQMTALLVDALQTCLPSDSGFPV
jgi:hypothetical protein